MTLSLNTLDITSFKKKGQDLHDLIVQECKRLNNLNFQQYNVITMTQSQYDDLSTLSGHMIDQFHNEDMMYKTPYNIMEVRVDKRKKLTFEEAMNLDDKSFNEWEKENEHRA